MQMDMVNNTFQFTNYLIAIESIKSDALNTKRN